MNRDEWWKNFALGMEVDASGTFIYNGIHALDGLESFHHPVDVFEVLYNLSIGIERLLKVAIVLIEHDQHTDMETFEESLKSHNTVALAQRVGKGVDIDLSSVQWEFLSLLATFYKTHRYGRYSLSAVPDIEEEKKMFLIYISKHLNIPLATGDDFFPAQNTDRIRKFIGRVVKGIIWKVFSIIGRESTRLNIYTTELRGDSKALKVFYGERLDFIDERVKKKEMILYLMSQDARGAHIDLLRSCEPLDLDPAMTPYYIKALLNDRDMHFVEGEIDVLYEEVENIAERLGFIGIVDDGNLSLEGDEEV